MKLQIYDPSLNQFVRCDAGELGTEALLLNILVELRIHSMILQAMNPGGIVTDDLTQLRRDAVSDPATFNPDPNV